MIGLEGMSCDNQLRTLCLSGLEERRLKTDFIALYCFLKRGKRDRGVELFLGTHDGSKLHQMRFRLDIWEHLFTTRIIKQWNRLPERGVC